MINNIVMGWPDFKGLSFSILPMYCWVIRFCFLVGFFCKSLFLIKFSKFLGNSLCKSLSCLSCFQTGLFSTSEHLGKELNSYKKYFDHEPGT